MHRTIQRELMGAAAAAILFTVVLLGLTVPRAVERSLRAEQQRALLAESELAARLVAAALAPTPRSSSVRPAGSAGVSPVRPHGTMRAGRPRSQGDAHSTTSNPRLEQLARELGRMLNAEAVIVEPGGGVLAGAGERGAGPVSLATRPEIARALAGAGTPVPGWESTGGSERLLAAAPVRRGSRVIGAVRLARPLAPVRREAGALLGGIFAVLAACAVLALLLALRVARGIAQPVAAISAIAHKMAAGELQQQRAPVAPLDEVAELGRAFNSMAVRIRDIVGQLWQERNKLVTILKKMTDGIVLTDSDGRITLLNPAAQRILALNADVAIGKPLLEATLNFPLHAMLQSALQSRAEVADEVRVTLDATRALQLQIYAAPVESDTGAAEGAMLVLHDLTELRRLEEVRKQFVANASHELRTPLTSIKMMTETLLAGAKDTPEARDRFLSVIALETDRLVALVNDLLDLSRIESGGAQLHLEPVLVRDLVEEVREEMQPKAEERGQTLHTAAMDGLQVLADPAALRQILLNLVDNAVKYTPAGGKVEIAAAAAGDRTLISVRDTGIGIPRADIHRIFERFYRVDKARSRQLGGTGLGLAIVKHLLEAQHATITVESELNRGSTFILSLPTPDRGAT
jgi:two-component system, OmpR family, phosphate regulon sensor histidine kinase PhoR